MRIFCFENSGRNPDPDRQIENVFGQFGESLEHGAAAGQHNAGAGLPFVTRAANLIADEMNDFFGARLKDVAQHLLRNRARLARSHADNLEDVVLIRHRGNRAALLALEPFGFRNVVRKPDRNVVAEMFATDRQNHRVPNGAVVIDRHAGLAASDIDQNGAQFLFIVAENGFAAAIGSSTVSSASSPLRFTAVTIVCAAVVELVTM